MDRLASRVAQGGVLTVEEAFRQIAHHIHLLIHVRLVDDTWRGGVRTRTVAEIRQLTGGLESGRPVSHLAYSDGPGGGFSPDAAILAELAPFQSAWEAG